MGIMIVGVGGAGVRVIEQMRNSRAKDRRYLAVDTEKMSIPCSISLQKLQLGDGSTGSPPEECMLEAVLAEEQIKEYLWGADFVFLIAGLGGGCGTGVAPVIARIAEKCHIPTAAIVTLPFRFEGGKRTQTALIGLEKLRKEISSVTAVSLDEKKAQLGQKCTFNDVYTAFREKALETAEREYARLRAEIAL